MAQWNVIIREGAKVFDCSAPAGARLDRLSQFLMFHHNEMLQSTERWRQFIDKEEPPVRSSIHLEASDN